MQLVYGVPADIENWMKLVTAVRWNFPGLETQEELDEHQATVLRFMSKRQAICVKKENEIIGVMLFSRGHNMICCLAVSPENRRCGVASMLMDEALKNLDRTKEISVSTFRADDEKGPAPRAFYEKYGFVEGALIEEMGYPNQKYILHPVGSQRTTAKVILICGKICSGKSTYAGQIRVCNHAVLLSADEITLALFGQSCGEQHDEYVEKTQNYLFNKSLELIEAGINVILDWGFWMKEEREYARNFYSSRSIEYEFHYIDISDETWRARLRKRNSAIAAGETNAYYIDENVAAKFGALFEEPGRDEIDVWIAQ